MPDLRPSQAAVSRIRRQAARLDEGVSLSQRLSAIRSSPTLFLLSPGEQQRHRAAREDQDVPCFAGHDQGPLGLGPAYDRGASPCPRSRRPPPHVAFEPPHPHTFRHVERGPASPSQRHEHFVRACSCSLPCNASPGAAAALRSEYVPSYFYPRFLVVNSRRLAASPSGAGSA